MRRGGGGQGGGAKGGTKRPQHCTPTTDANGLVHAMFLHINPHSWPTPSWARGKGAKGRGEMGPGFGGRGQVGGGGAEGTAASGQSQAPPRRSGTVALRLPQHTPCGCRCRAGHARRGTALHGWLAPKGPGNCRQGRTFRRTGGQAAYTALRTPVPASCPKQKAPPAPPPPCRPLPERGLPPLAPPPLVQHNIKALWWHTHQSLGRARCGT